MGSRHPQAELVEKTALVLPSAGIGNVAALCGCSGPDLAHSWEVSEDEHTYTFASQRGAHR
jgi:hypothetical protein